MEPRYNEEPRDWQICSLYRGSFSSILLYSDWGNENRTLYQRLRYTEAPLYLDVGKRSGYLPQIVSNSFSW